MTSPICRHCSFPSRFTNKKYILGGSRNFRGSQNRNMRKLYSPCINPNTCFQLLTVTLLSRFQGSSLHLRHKQRRSSVRGDGGVRSGKHIRLRLRPGPQAERTGAIWLEMGRLQCRHQLRREVREEIYGREGARRR